MIFMILNPILRIQYPSACWEDKAVLCTYTTFTTIPIAMHVEEIFDDKILPFFIQLTVLRQREEQQKRRKKRKVVQTYILYYFLLRHQLRLHSTSTSTSSPSPHSNITFQYKSQVLDPCA